MKALISIILLTLLSVNVSAHCGSCGMGGSSDDHAEGEDKTHHDKDARYEEAAEKKAELLEDSEDTDSEDE